MNNLQNILQTRCTFYAFLARIFRTEADQQLLEALNGISFPEKSGDPVWMQATQHSRAGKQRLAAIRSQNLPSITHAFFSARVWPAKTQLIRMNRFTRVLRDL
mgnify:CR=1 FL=1